MESLMTAVEELPFILESEDKGRLFLRESLDFETYIPAKLQVSIVEEGGGSTMVLQGDTAGEGMYHDMHLKNLMEDLVMTVEEHLPTERRTGDLLNDSGSLTSELSLLSDLHSKGLLTDPEFELAKKKVLDRAMRL